MYTDKISPTVTIPEVFIEAYHKQLILALILFGSSQYLSKSKDIDLAIITKKGLFDEFIDLIESIYLPDQFDISLIKEEEIYSGKDFFFLVAMGST